MCVVFDTPCCPVPDRRRPPHSGSSAHLTAPGGGDCEPAAQQTSSVHSGVGVLWWAERNQPLPGRASLRALAAPAATAETAANQAEKDEGDKEEEEDDELMVTDLD